MFLSLSTHHSIKALPSAILGDPAELTMVVFAGWQTFSQYSTLTARGDDIGAPALGPEMSALSGIRAGRKAKSYIV